MQIGWLTACASNPLNEGVFSANLSSNTGTAFHFIPQSHVYSQLRNYEKTTSHAANAIVKLNITLGIIVQIASVRAIH